MSSQAQIHANRENAKKSTGPASSEGKAKVSHNALKTGLTGRTVLLPTDDAAAFEAHTASVFSQYSPETDEEKRLAQSIADTLWRLERIPSLQAGIYAIGRLELASEFAGQQDEAVRKAMIEAKVYLTYRRDLNNLSLQESRLLRRLQKEDAELKRLIADRHAAAKRKAEEKKRCWEKAYDHYCKAKRLGIEFFPEDIGFEFSTEELIQFAKDQFIAQTKRDGSYYDHRKNGSIVVTEEAA